MKNRPILTRAEQEKIIRKCQVCNIAMIDSEEKPYVIPMNFGFDGEYVYLHGSSTGKKVDALKHCSDVCIAFSTDHELRYVNEEVACSWSMRYRSVLVHGKAEFVDDPEEKTRCLNIIMSHYSERKFEFNAPSIKEVMVFRVRIDKIDGRTYGY